MLLDPTESLSQLQAPYSKKFVAGWASIDANGHLANTSYLDLAADARIAFFGDHGFTPAEFRQFSIGAVIQRDQIEYFREIHLHDLVTVTFVALAMSDDAARFIFENEIWTAEGERSAVIRSTGGWLDLTERKLITPPPPLRAVLRMIPKSPAFVEMEARTGR